MSFCEDDTFCHYCGRYPSIGNGLEWDHVPALNVKIPEDCDGVRKTLVRSCRECNSMASDIAHLDYIERHFWLKAAYLRKYKKILVNEGDYGEESDYEDSLLRGVIFNAKKNYEDILYAIGFGIKSIDEIESPVLNLKTKSKKRISSLLLGYINGSPSEDEFQEINVRSEKFDKEDVKEKAICSYNDFIEFLLAEHPSGWRMDTQDSYVCWIKSHPSRFRILKLPEWPVFEYSVPWADMALSVAEILSKEKMKGQCLSRSGEFCSYNDFIDFVKYGLAEEEFEEKEDYQFWFAENKLIALGNNLPNNPDIVYGLEWSVIKRKALRKKKNSKFH